MNELTMKNSYQYIVSNITRLMGAIPIEILTNENYQGLYDFLQNGNLERLHELKKNPIENKSMGIIDLLIHESEKFIKAFEKVNR